MAEDVKFDNIEIKEEICSDEEFEFEFSIDDTEYDEILKELRAKDSDLEEIGDEGLSCPMDGCNKSFSRRYNLTRHLRSHQVGAIETTGNICHICGKNIKGVYSLHLKIHDNIKPFRCDECGREFRQKIALRNHLLIHQNEKPHECPWCFKKFRQKYSLQHHTKRHTGVKEFICDLCGKEFSDKVTMHKHSLVHSTNKPHQCGTCFMSFRHKSSLSRHTKIHLKTTQCHLCHRSFRYESFLKKHLITAHQDEDAINQPQYNAFVKDYRQRFIPSTKTREDGSSQHQSEDCVVMYDEQNASQVIQIDASQYYGQPSRVIVNNVQNFT
ncbi:zinc finger protein 501-like [Chironomus tepperi]|uniref:zinc finger protein 501-like n=1 Tax=Chironomus tepperi TaxID=113505 RepID=UPI00391F11FF